MKNNMASKAFENDELLFVPLGGTEEIGMNFNLYGYGPPNAQKWIIFDLGLTFGDDTNPSIDVILPDPKFLSEGNKDILAIVLTHGHEDHIGAVPYLWEKLKCPIYATPFTASLLRSKLQFETLTDVVKINEIQLNGKFNLGPFSLELVTLTHSMPEPNACLIQTPMGSLFHTGDWKFDPNPVIGETANINRLTEIGDAGVLAVIGDSTNSFVKGVSGSEGDILNTLTSVISACEGRIAVACFASNVARLKTIYNAALANGRAVCLIGRSLWRMNAAARENGYLSAIPPFLEASQVGNISADQILFICTGSQGEPRAALSRIASNDHREIKLVEGDTVIFSSRKIPGNELSISRLKNKFIKNKVAIIDEEQFDIHVSGHPSEDELIEMYSYLRPELVIPVHGEPRHIAKHAEIAKRCQIPETMIVNNGSMVRLAPGKAKIIDQVHAGRLALDGQRIIPLESHIIKDRMRIMYNGVIFVSVSVNEKDNRIKKLKIAAHGLVDDEEVNEIRESSLHEINLNFAELGSFDILNEPKMAETVRIIIRRKFRERTGKRPITSVHIV